jgi:hypothetical protein
MKNMDEAAQRARYEEWRRSGRTVPPASRAQPWRPPVIRGYHYAGRAYWAQGNDPPHLFRDDPPGPPVDLGPVPDDYLFLKSLAFLLFVGFLFAGPVLHWW